jgi:hypothetical protein
VGGGQHQPALGVVHRAGAAHEVAPDARADRDHAEVEPLGGLLRRRDAARLGAVMAAAARDRDDRDRPGRQTPAAHAGCHLPEHLLAGLLPTLHNPGEWCRSAQHY